MGPTSRNQVLRKLEKPGFEPRLPALLSASWVLLRRSNACWISGHRASSRPSPWLLTTSASPWGLSGEETHANNERGRRVDLLGTGRTAAFKGALGDSPLPGPGPWPLASRMYPPCLPIANVWHRVDAQRISVRGTWGFQACGGTLRAPGPS